MKENNKPSSDESEQDEFNDKDHEFDCDSDISKYLKEYDIKLLKSMKGFGKTMILWLISKGRTHGYELMSQINEISPSAEETCKRTK